MTDDGSAAPPARGPPSAASIARFSLSAEAFALAPLFERVPDAQAVFEPTVADSSDRALLVVQTAKHDRTVVETTLRTDPKIETVETIRAHADGWRYRVTWDRRTRSIVQRLLAEDVTLLSARGRDGVWTLRVLAAERNAIARANETIQSLDPNAECQYVSNVGGGRIEARRLTDEQREALLMAFAAGYYNIPRDVTATELADEIGISHQALSERFRRAYGQLVSTELAIDDDAW